VLRFFSANRKVILRHSLRPLPRITGISSATDLVYC